MLLVLQVFRHKGSSGEDFDLIVAQEEKSQLKIHCYYNSSWQSIHWLNQPAGGTRVEVWESSSVANYLQSACKVIMTLDDAMP